MCCSCPSSCCMACTSSGPGRPARSCACTVHGPQLGDRRRCLHPVTPAAASDASCRHKVSSMQPAQGRWLPLCKVAAKGCAHGAGWAARLLELFCRHSGRDGVPIALHVHKGRGRLRVCPIHVRTRGPAVVAPLLRLGRVCIRLPARGQQPGQHLRGLHTARSAFRNWGAGSGAFAVNLAQSCT